MALTKNQILEAIDGMTIYTQDFYTIKNLLENSDSNFFVKVLEEVINGNLYWSDFDKVLANTNYGEVLENNIEIQEQMRTEIARLFDFRQNIALTSPSLGLNNIDATVTNIGIIKSTAADEKLQDLYDQEEINLREKLYHDVLRYKKNDTELTITCKNRLLNAIENGRIIDSSGKDLSGVTINTVESTVTSNGITYEYIDPRSILFSTDELVIPLDYRYQTLSESDLIFMKANNLNEVEMKKMKALSGFLRREQCLKEIKK